MYIYIYIEEYCHAEVCRKTLTYKLVLSLTFTSSQPHLY